MRYIFLLLVLLLSSCSKDSLEVCGTITGGDYDYVNDMYYLRVDGKRVWVDMKTWESLEVGDYECFTDW